MLSAKKIHESKDTNNSYEGSVVEDFPNDVAGWIYTTVRNMSVQEVINAASEIMLMAYRTERNAKSIARWSSRAVSAHTCGWWWRYSGIPGWS